MKFNPLIKNKFISTVIGTLALFIGGGFIFPISNFSVYITSYIHLRYPSITMHYGMFINLIFSFMNTFSHPIGGYLENILGFRKTILFGFIILFIGNLFFIFQQNIWLCYSLIIILGFGLGIGTSLLGKNITFYYPSKKGIISGLMGIGILFIAGSFALTGEKIIAYGGYTLKKGEKFYPDYISNRTYIYFMMGEFFIPIGLILGLLLIYEYKPEYSQERNLDLENKIDGKTQSDISTKENVSNSNQNQLQKENSKKNVKHALKTLRFWRISLISFFINFTISFMINTSRTFGALIGINGSALQFSAIFQAIALIIIGPILGILVDKKGPLFILRIISINSIIPCVLLTFFMDKTLIFIISSIINVINITGLMVSFGSFIMEVYGIQESVILGGIINGFSKIGEIITTVAAFIFSLKYEEVNELKKPYRIMYIISAICCSISSFLLFIETIEKFNYKSQLIEESLNSYEMKKVDFGGNDSMKKEKINNI